MNLIYGPTKPLDAPPNLPRDEIESKELYAAVASLSVDQTDVVVSFLEAIALCLVKQVITEQEGQWVRAYPFGSGGLGASVADSDLDIVLFCPFKVTPDLFFREFPILLRRSVSDAVVIPARVPVVKFTLNGTSVDVVFVSVALAAPPTQEQLLDDSFLLQVAGATRPSANGLRTVLEVKRRVPVALDVYTSTLKVVKLWAMRRKVYGSLYSYPSGVVLAVMVARASQVLPATLPSALLRFFFLFYTQWFCRHDRIAPVYITTSLQSRQGRIPGLPESWNPQNEMCKADLLPVINPAYPYVNDARNVGRCGLEVFYAELTRAHRILANCETYLPLEEIWKPFCIKDSFSTFILVHVACEEGVEGMPSELETWSSYIASKLRIFIYGIERVADARPHPNKLKDGANHCFAIAVKERNGGCKLHQSMFAGAFEELKFSILEGCRKKDGRGFHRNEKTMRMPWFSLVDSTNLPPSIRM